jgi:hypothetical protein
MAKKKSSPGAKAKAPAPKAKAPAPKAKAASSRRQSWLDDDSGEPMIHDYARRINSFLGAMADGRVEAGELSDQEQRLVALMKRIEPKLDDALHAEVTELLCELSAYNIMHTIFEIAEARPATKFRG